MATVAPLATVSAPYSVSGVQLVDGVRVVGVHGGVPAVLGTSSTSSATVYVPVVGPPLPVEEVFGGPQQGVVYTDTITFGRWGESVTATRPSGFAWNYAAI